MGINPMAKEIKTTKATSWIFLSKSNCFRFDLGVEIVRGK